MIHLLWSDNKLTITPTDEKIEKKLTVWVKDIEIDRGKSTIRRKKKCIFKRHKEREDTIHTMQGYCMGMYRFLMEEGYDVQLHDLRQPFPKPKLELMHGFRYSQEQLVTDFLKADKSGLLGAPTRYGKTTCILNTLRAYTGLTTVVTAPGRDLVRQLYDDIRTAMPHREVFLLGAGSKRMYPSDDITVISMDSIKKADFGRTMLLLVDEPHAAVTTSRLPYLNKFDKARRLGFGATLTGRFDNKDTLIEGLFGPVIVERTYTEAVKEGAICPLRVYMIKIPLNKSDIDPSWGRTKAFNQLLYRSDRLGRIVRRICKELLPDDWQTILFINNEKQADHYLRYVGKEGTIAMAKKVISKKDREALMESMKSDDIKRCLASNIYAQGVTFNHVRAMINLAGGGNNTMTIQKPGRLAEVRDGKKMGVIFDFNFRPVKGTTEKSCGPGVRMLFNDSKNRRKAYEEKGYEIIEVDTYEAMEKSFTSDCI